MSGRRTWAPLPLAVALLLAVALPSCAESSDEEPGAAAEQTRAGTPPAFETPPVLKAADVLPAELQKGPDFHVAPEVRSDGFMNHYLLKTTWGDLHVVSTPLLRKRVRETAAIRELEDISRTEEFAHAAGENLSAAGRGAKKLVKHPVESAKSASSGVKRLFGKAKGRASAEQASETEDESWKQTVGYSQKKRELAVRIGVDVYSHNPQLQEALDDMAWVDWSGKMAGRLGLAVVPGAAGAALSITKTNEKFQHIDPTQPPGVVRDGNRAKLTALGMPSDSIGRFIGDTTLSPTEQSLVVASLDTIDGAEGREAVLDFAAAAPDPDVAAFVVLQAMMYAQYHEEEQPIVRFEGVGPRLVARTADGGAVAIHPMDHLYWTEDAAEMMELLNADLGDAPHKLAWLGGVASERTRQGLASAGWELRENALSELLPE
jgi:hypothetical protein